MEDDGWRSTLQAELGELIWLLEERPQCSVNDVADRVRALHEYMELQRRTVNECSDD